MQSFKGTNHCSALHKTHTNLLRTKSSEMQLDQSSRDMWNWELLIASRSSVSRWEVALKVDQKQSPQKNGKFCVGWSKGEGMQEFLWEGLDSVLRNSVSILKFFWSHGSCWALWGCLFIGHLLISLLQNNSKGMVGELEVEIHLSHLLHCSQKQESSTNIPSSCKQVKQDTLWLSHWALKILVPSWHITRLHHFTSPLRGCQQKGHLCIATSF